MMYDLNSNIYDSMTPLTKYDAYVYITFPIETS